VLEEVRGSHAGKHTKPAAHNKVASLEITISCEGIPQVVCLPMCTPRVESRLECVPQLTVVRHNSRAVYGGCRGVGADNAWEKVSAAMSAQGCRIFIISGAGGNEDGLPRRQHRANRGRFRDRYRLASATGAARKRAHDEGDN